MEDFEKMIDLKDLEEQIRKSFPELESKLYEQFLKISKVSLQGLKFLANFSLIFSEIQECKFCVRLITYHGRTLDTIIFQSTKEEIIPPKVCSMLLNLQDRIMLCQGVELEKANVDSKSSCLIECLNDIFIVRSQRCKFLLPSKSDTRECGECQKLAKIKEELVSEIKEDVIEESNDYNEFVDYEEDWMMIPEILTDEEEPKKKRGRPAKKLSVKNQARKH